MAVKLNIEWSEDIYGKSILLVSKKRGKLSVEEVGDALRYNQHLQGNYIMFIQAGEVTCEGSGWIDELENKGDTWELYKLEEYEKCPVCNHELPTRQYCPECGHPLNGVGQEEKEAIKNAERILDAMKAESLNMIKSTQIQETRKAWYHSHLGSIDFARQMGLITEERRQQLYKEFKKELKEGQE